MAEAHVSTLPTASAERVSRMRVTEGVTNKDGKLDKSTLIVMQIVS